MSTLTAWAAQYGVSAQALVALNHMLGAHDYIPAPNEGPAGSVVLSEAAVQAATRVRASKQGKRLWRNNVGVLKDERGVPVRYGLANDSKAVNDRIKSGDLIGINPRIITPQDVGTLIGQFVSIECKESGWRYTGSPREEAQRDWALLVTSLGGEAKFLTDARQL